jgi:hypothetical protein
MSRTLAYHSPAADHAGLTEVLRREDLMFRVRWAGLLALGAIVLWLAPAVVSWRIYVGRAWHDPSPTPWPVMLLICGAVMVPILFMVERATRGRFLEDTLDRVGGATPLSGSFVYAEGLGLLVVFEIFLWGPRMTIAATKQLRAASRIAPASLAGPAAVLARLLQHNDGQSTADVMTQTGLGPTVFSDALAYLAFHDYVGISKDGTRVWLNTDARRRLAHSRGAARE